MLPKAERTCIDCGKLGVSERRRCKECAKLYNAKRMREHVKKNGRYNYGVVACSVCGNDMILWRKDQLSHTWCRPSKFRKNDSLAQHGRYEGNKLLKSLGVEKPKGYVLHHLDQNPENNEVGNLILMPSASHASLHRYLDLHRSLWLKNQGSNLENCWNTLRDHLTTAWLETASVNVIKIGDIGQPAAKIRN